MNASRCYLVSAAVVAAMSVSHAVRADPAVASEVDRDAVPEWAARLVHEPGTPAARAYAETRKKQLQVERELKQIRFKHFTTRHRETRQAGIAKVRAYTDPAVFPTLLSVFEHEEQDVREAVLDHLADQRSENGDAALAWAAVFGKDEWGRSAASARLRARIPGPERVSKRVRAVIVAGLRDASDEAAASAAALASAFDLYDLLPSIINAQVGGPSGGGAGVGGGAPVGVGGAIATIFIGTQQTFVSDLQPVVGDGAVGFDPTLSVVTEGSYITVYDAVVTTYRTEVHNTLVAMADRAWDGRSTAGLAYNARAWQDWYTNQFLPYQAAKAAAAKPAP